MNRDILNKIIVWGARLILGGTFIISGWAKCVDLWGFVYKAEDYLAVWGMASAVPREFTLVGAAALSMTEFCTGLMLALGCMRRGAAVIGTAIMAFMLPLSGYIAVENPVADCGCFGDLLVISNGATLAKNVILTALAVYLLYRNRRVAPLFVPGVQWIVLALGIVYSLTVSVLGWQFQPVVDFRPFPVGSRLTAEAAGEGSEPVFVYEKEGRREEFAFDRLPDSTWTFVSAIHSRGSDRPDDSLAFFDDDGNEVTADVLEYGAQSGGLLLLTVPEPGYDNLTRARFANELSDYAAAHDIAFAGVVAASEETLGQWRALARPHFEMYSASDTSLKQLVRGSMGLVWVRDGKIVLKRNFSNIDPDLLSRSEPLESLTVISDGHVATWLTAALTAALILLWLTQHVFTRKNSPNSPAAPVKTSD